MVSMEHFNNIGNRTGKKRIDKNKNEFTVVT